MHKALSSLKTGLSAVKAFVLPQRKIVPPKELKLNHDTGMLKLLACLLMLSDHMGKMIFTSAYRIRFSGAWSALLPQINIFRGIGRLAMPLFAYCVAVGCNYTRNIWKYVLRLFLLGILVHPLYQEAMGHVPFMQLKLTGNVFEAIKHIYEYYYQGRNLNILFTLGSAVLILACYRHRRYAGLALAVALTVHWHSRIDYGYEGVFLVILFYALLDRPFVSAFSVVLFFVNWCIPRLLVDFTVKASTEIYALLCLPLIYIPIKKRYVRLPKWTFYAFYPAHLLLIFVLLWMKTK
ncbi:MAG: hypothetical protein II920_02655 [Clostridia bacterium]|nr:hypothetical protein [Clostridia bacterium]